MKKGDDGEQSDSEMYEDALQELREALHLLTIDPGDFQQMMPNFASRFSSLVSKGVCPLSDLIEEIFEQVVFTFHTRIYSYIIYNLYTYLYIYIYM